MPRDVEQTLATLKVMQAVDDELARLRQGVAALSLRVDVHRKRVTELEGQLESKGAELRTEEKASAKKELDLKVIGDRIRKLREQLMTLTSNKAYAAMTGEIGGHEAESRRAEEEILRVMEKIETVRADMAEIRRQIAEAQEAVRREEAAVAGEVRDLSGRIRQLMSERQALGQQLDKVVAEKYERIARSKNGRAVVAVKDGTCQGCNMGVTRQTIARLWAKKELLHCPNCARLMYLEGGVQ